MSTTIASPSSGVVQRLIAFRERYGSFGAFYKTVDVLMHKVLRASVHEVVWLDIKSLTELAPADPQFEFRFLTAEEVERFARDETYYLSPTLPDGIRQGRELCFGALAGDRLAAFGCYTLNYVPPQQAAGAAMSFPADVAYMSYGLTHPDFRGARLHGLVMGLALERLAERGVTKLVSLVSWTNWASLKSCWRLGYIGVGRMLTIGGRKHAIGFYPRRAKRMGVRFGRKAKVNAR